MATPTHATKTQSVRPSNSGAARLPNTRPAATLPPLFTRVYIPPHLTAMHCKYEPLSLTKPVHHSTRVHTTTILNSIPVLLYVIFCALCTSWAAISNHSPPLFLSLSLSLPRCISLPPHPKPTVIASCPLPTRNRHHCLPPPPSGPIALPTFSARRCRCRQGTDSSTLWPQASA